MRSARWFWRPAAAKTPKIDKVYNTVYINSAASSFQGSLTQGQAVAQGTKITLAYTNGLGKSAQVLLPEVNGLYCDPIDVRLASPTSSDNGNGTVEIPVSGTPTASGSMNLRPVIRVGEYEVFISIPATVTPAIALDAAASVVTGTFRIGQAIANGNIALHYTSYANQEVTVSADEVSGISIAEFTASLPAAPSGGTLDVPVTGTPSDYGTKTLKITMTQGDNTYTADIPVEIAGDIALDAAGRYRNRHPVERRRTLRRQNRAALHGRRRAAGDDQHRPDQRHQLQRIRRDAAGCRRRNGGRAVVRNSGFGRCNEPRGHR